MASETENKLLTRLPEEVLRRLEPGLERVRLELGATLNGSGDQFKYVYFPIDSIVSLLSVLNNGSSAEIAVVGNDGAVGISLFMGGASTATRAVVQGAGEAMRLGSTDLLLEFERGGVFQHLLLRYTHTLITQIAQTAVCNRLHSLDQQLCRWLLLSLDLLPSNVIHMTQDLIASMLGVRRESVTDAAGKLQAAGIIKYYRGQITVLDRPKLEARVCECYAVVKRDAQRILAPPATHRPLSSVT